MMRGELQDDELTAHLERRASVSADAWVRTALLDAVRSASPTMARMTSSRLWLGASIAGVVGALVLAVALAPALLPGRPVATSSAPTASSTPGPPPSADATGVSATDRSGPFSLTLSAGRTEYVAGEPITDIAATLVYEGLTAVVQLSGVQSLINSFGLEQLDGPLDARGGWDLPCVGHSLRRGEPLSRPFEKGGGYSNDDPNADLYRAFFADPDLRLPAGTWKVSVYSRFLDGPNCSGPQIELEASIVITTRPTAASSAGRAPTASTPQAARHECPGNDPEHVSDGGYAVVIDETGLIESCQTVPATGPLTVPREDEISVWNVDVDTLRVWWPGGVCGKKYEFEFRQTPGGYFLDGRLEPTWCFAYAGPGTEIQLELKSEVGAPAVAATMTYLNASPNPGDPCPWRPRADPYDGFDANRGQPFCHLNVVVPSDRLSLAGIGPSHCGWGPVAFLSSGWPLGTAFDGRTLVQFVRDPDGVLREYGLAAFQTVPALPPDAVDTALTNGNVHLFFSPSEGNEAVYGVMGSVIERWPRAPELIACR